MFDRDKKKIEKVMDSYDKIFKTLVMPVSFIIMLTWAFFFFLGNILAGQNLELLEARILDFYLPHVAFHLAIFVSSLFIWSLSVFARAREMEIRLWKWKTGYQGVARFLKRNSLGFLFAALLIAPAQIIVSALGRTVEPGLALNIYFIAIFAALILLITFLPRVNRSKKQILSRRQ